MTSATISQTTFKPAARINHSLTAALEKRALLWMAARAPLWVTSDKLTLLGFAAQFGAGLSYALPPALTAAHSSPPSSASHSTGSATRSTEPSPASAIRSGPATASTSITWSTSSAQPLS